MKKLVLLAFSVLLLTACSSGNEVDNNENLEQFDNSVEFNIEEAEVVEENEYVETSYDKGQYYTVIKDDSGNELYTIGPSSSEPSTEMVNENLLKVSYISSDNFRNNVCSYFDFSTSTSSVVYNGVADETDSKVAVVIDNIVELYDIFGNDTTKQVIDTFENEFSDTSEAIFDVEFSEDGSEISVSYYSGHDYTEKVETFKVN